MRPTIYLPIWFMQSLSDKTRTEILEARYTKGISIGYTGNEFEIKLIEDNVYSKCSLQFEKIYEREEKLFDLEREVEHLRKVKASVDQIKNLFKGVI